jgi:anti-sigma-K factor RskA
MNGHEQYREDLVLYAAGALTAEEVRDMEVHLADCASCREELQGLRAAAAQIALAVQPVAPPAQLRDQLMSRLEYRAPVPVSIRKQNVWFWVPAIAAVLSLFVAARLWVETRGLRSQNRQLSLELSENQKNLESANSLIRGFTAADAQRVTLAASGAKVQPGAKAVYSPSQGSLILLADHLDTLPAQKVYELWLLPANGSNPVPAGTFRPDGQGKAALIRSRFGSGLSAKGFAITIENAPGAATPTMPIILVGTV